MLLRRRSWFALPRLLLFVRLPSVLRFQLQLPVPFALRLRFGIRSPLPPLFPFVPLPFVLLFLLPRLFFRVRLLPFRSRFILLFLFVRLRLQLFVPLPLVLPVPLLCLFPFARLHLLPFALQPLSFPIHQLLFVRPCPLRLRFVPPGPFLRFPRRLLRCIPRRLPFILVNGIASIPALIVSRLRLRQLLLNSCAKVLTSLWSCA